MDVQVFFVIFGVFLVGDLMGVIGRVNALFVNTVYISSLYQNRFAFLWAFCKIMLIT